MERGSAFDVWIPRTEPVASSDIDVTVSGESSARRDTALQIAADLIGFDVARFLYGSTAEQAVGSALRSYYALKASSNELNLSVLVEQSEALSVLLARLVHRVEQSEGSSKREVTLNLLRSKICFFPPCMSWSHLIFRAALGISESFLPACCLLLEPTSPN